MNLADVQKLFEDTPAHLWCENALHKGNQRCSIGLIREALTGHPTSGSLQTSDTIHKLLKPLSQKLKEAPLSAHTFDPWETLVRVNNGCIDKYPQDNPRDRVLAFLRDYSPRPRGIGDE